MATLVLTVIGDDRPGLVSELSAVVEEHGGNWLTSQMARLAGKFAGIVLIDVPSRQVATLTGRLEALADGGLVVTVTESGSPAETTAHRFTLHLLGHDHPGIVHHVTEALAAQRVSIEEFHTSIREAPMAGGTLFVGEAVLRAPLNVAADDVRPGLEKIAHELMVDIELSGE